MCGRFTNKMTWQEIHDLYDITNDDFRPNLKPRYNIAPTQIVPVVKPGRELALMRWGFERYWAKNSIINATAEKVATSRVFKKVFEERRCIVPADGFYEWKKTEDGKQPYRIILMGEKPFAFAGIWETWTTDKDGRDFVAGDNIESFCIVTTQANAVLKAIHGRMLVILDATSWNSWLDGSRGTGLLEPYPSERMAFHPVSTRVNSVRNDDEALIEEAT